MTATLIDHPAQNDDLLAALRAADRVGIDTEFMREKTFYAQLCLVQIATPTRIFCADPLGEAVMTPLWDALAAVGWILHSGRQDIEVLYHAADRMPASVFDTQIAAALVGYPAQMGYAALVSELFGVELPKGHTRADWTRRPLPAAMLEYAAEDVAYLLEAEARLGDRLRALGRLDWALADSADLLDEALYRFEPAAAVDRLKAARNLRGAARQIAVRLAAWREARAQAADRPRQWILKDPVLVDLAIARPGNETELAAVRGMPPTTVKRSGRELLREIERALREPNDYVPPRPPDEGEKALLKRLQQAVSAKAKELGIAGEVLAPRKELSAAIRGDRSGRVFRGWRLDIVGGRLLEMLA